MKAMEKKDEKTDANANTEKDDEAIAIIADTVLTEHLITMQNPAISTDSVGVAIQGYDPVAYFVAKQAMQGEAKHFAIWEKALWVFASEENRKRFIASPASYVPGFGGYCTYCMALGHKRHADPEAWAVHKNKLYLHLSASIREAWLKDPGTYLKQAKTEWTDYAQTQIEPDGDTVITRKVLALIEKNRNK